MRYRTFGTSRLRVSELFLGAMTFGEQGGVGAPPQECRRILWWFRASRTLLSSLGMAGLRSHAGGQGATVSGSPGLMTLTGTSGTRRRAASTKWAGSLSLLRKSMSPTVPPVKASAAGPPAWGAGRR